MNKKIIIVVVVGVVALFLIIFLYKINQSRIMISNESYIENYIEENYPGYVLIDKEYLYLDKFWSTYYNTDTDDFNMEIICNAFLKNINTGMYVTVQFEHEKNGGYKPSTQGLAHNDIRDLVKDYEKYWNSINDLKSKYNTEIKVSNVEFDGSDNLGNIYGMIIYIKYNETVDIDRFVHDVENIDTNLEIQGVYYYFIKEDVYDYFYPWFESNTLRTNIKRVNQGDDFDLYYVYYTTYPATGVSKWVTKYYTIEK